MAFENIFKTHLYVFVVSSQIRAHAKIVVSPWWLYPLKITSRLPYLFFL
jgi:hypothetical protein